MELIHPIIKDVEKTLFEVVKKYPNDNNLQCMIKKLKLKIVLDINEEAEESNSKKVFESTFEEVRVKEEEKNDDDDDKEEKRLCKKKKLKKKEKKKKKKEGEEAKIEKGEEAKIEKGENDGENVKEVDQEEETRKEGEQDKREEDEEKEGGEEVLDGGEEGQEKEENFESELMDIEAANAIVSISVHDQNSVQEENQVNESLDGAENPILDKKKGRRRLTMRRVVMSLVQTLSKKMG
ncbi:hypothetical protein L6452_14330 [Arctium lappa]|uniref:Uncharacterized protein n=1 Tax=Arctium lappa TaxID=4217 RepID=A0ACB9CKS6_ARCLA|nr:hypothetical protein L6452_14330 [Arctium lappa]